MTGQLLHPFSPEGLRNPYPTLAAYRRLRPAYFDRGMNLYLLTGYRECRDALRDPAFSAAAGQQQRARDDALPLSMLTTDGDEHARLRSPAAAAFSARSIARLAGDLRAIAEDLVDGLDGEPATDMVTALAHPFATRVLGRLLCLEPGYWPALGVLARAAAPNLDPMIRGTAAERARRSAADLNDFLLVHSRRLRGGVEPTDLAGLPVTADLSEPERIGIFALTVIGGYEPLAVGAASALDLLLDRPAVLADLRADPAAIVGAVDEALRLESPIPFTARVCVDGYRTDSAEIPAGAVVLAMVGAANRDPAVFADPDVFDPGRSPNPHLALGGAAHFCLGAPVVRRSIEALLATLLHRMPALRRATGTAATRLGSAVPRGLATLPIAW
jgi:pimeloyl-[acyl-carrier protein] synthase